MRQQSENPYSTAKCKGNIPWIPRLKNKQKKLIMEKQTSLKLRNITTLHINALTHLCFERALYFTFRLYFTGNHKYTDIDILHQTTWPCPLRWSSEC